jgi:hypothetical protein
MSELLHEVVAKRERVSFAETVAALAEQQQRQRQRALRELHSIDLLTELLGEP